MGVGVGDKMMSQGVLDERAARTVRGLAAFGVVPRSPEFIGMGAIVAVKGFSPFIGRVVDVRIHTGQGGVNFVIIDVLCADGDTLSVRAEDAIVVQRDDIEARLKGAQKMLADFDTVAAKASA